MKPISPQEALKSRKKPKEVYEVVNMLIEDSLSNLDSGKDYFILMLEDIIKEVKERTDVSKYGTWIYDFEEEYIEAGWKVKYEKYDGPDFRTDICQKFTFKIPKEIL